MSTEKLTAMVARRGEFIHRVMVSKNADTDAVMRRADYTFKWYTHRHAPQGETAGWDTTRYTLLTMLDCCTKCFLGLSIINLNDWDKIKKYCHENGIGIHIPEKNVYRVMNSIIIKNSTIWITTIDSDDGCINSFDATCSNHGWMLSLRAYEMIKRASLDSNE